VESITLKSAPRAHSSGSLRILPYSTFGKDSLLNKIDACEGLISDWGPGLRRGAPTVDAGLAQHFRHIAHSGYIRLLYCKQRLLSAYSIPTNFFRSISFSL
jgi:hypothetical protein